MAHSPLTEGESLSKTAVPSRRRPREGGYPRGDEARARLIEAGVKIFGEQGYDQASTRAIASEARVTPPALQYYFDGKEGLHLACGQFMVAHMSEILCEPFNLAAAALKKRNAPAAAEALCSLLETMLDFSLASDLSPGRGRFLARAQADGAGPAFPSVRDGVVRPLHRVCTALVAAAMEISARDDEARLVAILLMNHLSAFNTNRDNTLAALNWTDFQGNRARTAKRTLRRLVLCAIAADGVRRSPLKKRRVT